MHRRRAHLQGKFITGAIIQSGVDINDKGGDCWTSNVINVKGSNDYVLNIDVKGLMNMIKDKGES